MTKITDFSHEENYTFLVTSPTFLSMRNVSDEICGENQNTHFIFDNAFPKIIPFVR